MNQILKTKKGITLVALVITIILLLILAGILIATLTNSGLFEKARLAEQEYKNAQEKEEGILDDYSNQINAYVGSVRQESLKIFIDTNRLIETIANDTEYNTNSYSYTATEDCAIVGDLFINNSTSGITIKINNITIGNLYSNSSICMGIPIYYFLGKGDTISFVNNNNKTTHKRIYAYGLK